MLSKCHKNSLNLAEEKGAKNVAFLAISTGAYGFPMERAAKIAVREVREYLINPSKSSSLERVIFICFNDDAYRSYMKALEDSRLNKA